MSRTRRMPLPPPPALGFRSTGTPISRAAAISSASVRPLPEEPGTTGTPAAFTVSLARILSPIREIASADGPMKTSPASAQARAKAAFSARKPYPGCTAWAPVRAAASSSRSTDR